MTLLDALLSEYSGGASTEGIRQALQVPLAQAFALYAAISARYNHQPTGPTYFERELLNKLEAARLQDTT